MVSPFCAESWVAQKGGRIYQFIVQSHLEESRPRSCMKVFCAVAQDPCAISVAMFAYPMEAWGAALGYLDEIRCGAGFASNRSGRKGGPLHGYCCETDQTNNRQYRHTHVVLR